MHFGGGAVEETLAGGLFLLPQISSGLPSPPVCVLVTFQKYEQAGHFASTGRKRQMKAGAQ